MPWSRILRTTAPRPPPHPSAIAMLCVCWPGALNGMSLGQDRRFVARTHQRAEHTVHWQQHLIVVRRGVDTVDFRQDARARGGHQAGVGGPPTYSQGEMIRKYDWERSTGCPGGTHVSWSPPLSLNPFIVMQTGLITRLTKGEVELGHRGQYDVPHKDGGTEQDPHGSADALMPRVRDDIGRG